MDRNFFKKSLSDILNAVLPVIFAFLLGGVVILLIHENPLEVYKILLLKSFFTEYLTLCRPDDSNRVSDCSLL